jgi:hypothetical protein
MHLKLDVWFTLLASLLSFSQYLHQVRPTLTNNSKCHHLTNPSPFLQDWSFTSSKSLGSFLAASLSLLNNTKRQLRAS